MFTEAVKVIPWTQALRFDPGRQSVGERGGYNQLLRVRASATHRQARWKQHNGKPATHKSRAVVPMAFM